jgi:hypothetical protein
LDREGDSGFACRWWGSLRYCWLGRRHLGIQVSALLRHIPATLALGEPGARVHVLDSSPADQAWHLLDARDGVGWVIAGKLLARKRPHLIPVWDHVVRCAMGYPENAWLWLVPAGSTYRMAAGPEMF